MFEMSAPEKSRTPFRGALAIVIGNMIGTGVFASIGYQAGVLPSGFVIALLWLLGGVLAFCGAVNYAELTAAFPKSGGEYQLLSRIYHPGVGFVSGWVSMIGGFPAPIALNALLIGSYTTGLLQAELEWLPRAIAAAVVVLMTGAHLVSVSFSGRFQWIFTLLKALLVAVFAVCGFLLAKGQPVSFLPQAGDGALLTSPDFFGSLIFVLFAYSGWNAACYIAGEVKDAQRTVPRALLLGTGIVTLLYVAMNAGMVYATPQTELAGSGDDGAFIAARNIFGETGGAVMAGLIAFGLLSTISAMMWAGPRVMQQVGGDHPAFLGWLGHTTKTGVPVVAVCIQGAVALLLVLTSNPKTIMNRTVFLLEVMTLLTVHGVMQLRRSRPDMERPVRAWGYPWTTLLYLGMVGWTMSVLNREDTVWGLGILAIGIVLYFTVRQPQPRKL
jgi:basic amino acid/polyamine antiporter, APA family